MKHRISNNQQPLTHQPLTLNEHAGKSIHTLGYTRGLVLVLGVVVCVASGSLALAGSDSSQTIQVSGTVEETFVKEIGPANSLSANGFDTLTGSLAGTAVVHIFTCEFSGDAATCFAKRIVFTSEGDLFLDDVGTVIGSTVSDASTVTGGTGIYKNATGQLILQGLILGNGVVTFTYTGSITLAN